MGSLESPQRRSHSSYTLLRAGTGKRGWALAWCSLDPHSPSSPSFSPTPCSLWNISWPLSLVCTADRPAEQQNKLTHASFLVGCLIGQTPATGVPPFIPSGQEDTRSHSLQSWAELGPSHQLWPTRKASAAPPCVKGHLWQSFAGHVPPVHQAHRTSLQAPGDMAVKLGLHPILRGARLQQVAECQPAPTAGALFFLVNPAVAAAITYIRVSLPLLPHSQTAYLRRVQIRKLSGPGSMV